MSRDPLLNTRCRRAINVPMRPPSFNPERHTIADPISTEYLERVDYSHAYWHPSMGISSLIVRNTA